MPKKPLQKKAAVQNKAMQKKPLQKPAKDDSWMDPDSKALFNKRFRNFDHMENYDLNDEVDPEDDEELDEDLAFNDSDMEKYGNLVSKRIPENTQDSEDSSDTDDAEMMDISDLLGTRPAKAIQNAPHSQITKILIPDSHHSDSEMEEFSSDESAEISNDDDLSTFITSLDAPKPKKIRVGEATEAFKESEFNLNPNKGKLDISTILAAVPTKDFPNILKHASTKAAEAAPLPTLAQDKLTRAAAYQEAKKQINHWIPIVKRNREAEQLVFPLQEAPQLVVTSNSLTSDFKAQTQLEKELEAEIKGTNMSEEAQLKLEELELNKISKEELILRREQLQKLRALAFYKEQKFKQTARIKSKTFRKLRKRDKLRAENLSLEELEELDPEAAKNEALKIHAERIKERMTLRHKANGKWAKKMLNKNNSGESRQELLEQIDRGKSLTKKISGIESGDDSSESLSDADDNDETRKSKAMERLLNLGEEYADENVLEETKNAKGLYSMKFMRKGLERQVKEVESDLKSTMKLISGDPISDSETNEPVNRILKFGNDTDSNYLLQDSQINTDFEALPQRNQTIHEKIRMKPVDFSAKRSTGLDFEAQDYSENELSSKEFEKIEKSKPKDESEKDEGMGNIEPINQNIASTSDHVATSDIAEISESETSKTNQMQNDSENPWLKTDSSKSFSKKSIKLTNQKTQSHIDKANAKLSARKKDVKESKNVLIDMETVKKLQTHVVEVEPVQMQMEFSESDSETEVGILSKPKKIRFNQVAGNIGSILENEFESEKKAIAEEDEGKVVDETLPGWGCWAGGNIKKKKDVKTSVQDHVISEKERKDVALKHVIINERRIKKMLKYTPSNVPFGFGTREQYEMSIRIPLGKEWNTNTFHEKLIAPRIVTQMGKAIRPMKRQRKI